MPHKAAQTSHMLVLRLRRVKHHGAGASEGPASQRRSSSRLALLHLARLPASWYWLWRACEIALEGYSSADAPASPHELAASQANARALSQTALSLLHFTSSPSQPPPLAPATLVWLHNILQAALDHFARFCTTAPLVSEGEILSFSQLRGDPFARLSLALQLACYSSRT